MLRTLSRYGSFLAVACAACSSPATNGPSEPSGATPSATELATVELVAPVVRLPHPVIASGAWHVCATLGDGVARCWGANLYGALGDGTTADSSTPRALPRFGDADVVDITAGYTHSCAVTADGAVFCWGEGRDGEIGDSANVERHAPSQVIGMHDATAVAAGTWRSCALRTDGTVWCWGNNVLGGLGNAQNVSSNVPVQVVGITDAVSVAAGTDHVCAVRASGGVRCWGRNESGQLGDGTTNDSNVPVDVVGISDAIAVGGGDAHSCAVSRDGRVSCWGANWYGMLGDGTTDGRSFAAPVRDVTGARTIAVTNLTTCAGLADGSERCWGSNEYGQLGDGTTRNVTVAVTPAFPGAAAGNTPLPLGAVGALSAGDTSCAIALGHIALCWGANYRGQVGDGTLVDRHRPIVVAPPTPPSSVNGLPSDM